MGHVPVDGVMDAVRIIDVRGAEVLVTKTVGDAEYDRRNTGQNGPENQRTMLNGVTWDEYPSRKRS